MNTPIETKVAAGAGTGGLASIVVLVLQLADPHLHINPALVSLIVTAVIGIAGYLAPHTSRPAAPPPAPSPSGSVQPPATTTGPMA